MTSRENSSAKRHFASTPVANMSSWRPSASRVRIRSTSSSAVPVRAGRADELGVDELRLPGVQAGVVVLVGAQVPVLGRDLVHEGAVPVQDPLEKGRGVDPLLVDLVVEVVDARHYVGPDGTDDPLRVGRLPGLEQGDVDERAIQEPVEVGAPRPRRTLAYVGHRFAHRDAPGRDGERQAVPVLPGEPHRARSEPGDVERESGARDSCT